MRGLKGFVTATLIIVAVSVLAGGCGDDSQRADPFVGTWRQSPGSGPNAQTPLIIAKSGDHYVATIVYWGPGDEPASPRPTVAIEMTRSGNTLSGTFGSDPTLRAQIVYVPETGHLTWANSRTPDGPLNAPDELVKVSSGTAYPTTP